MSDSNSKRNPKRSKKCRIKCGTCEFYDAPLDYCSERDIENCTKQSHINFSSCDDFLIREDLVMF